MWRTERDAHTQTLSLGTWPKLSSADFGLGSLSAHASSGSAGRRERVARILLSLASQLPPTELCVLVYGVGLASAR